MYPALATLLCAAAVFAVVVVLLPPGPHPKSAGPFEAADVRGFVFVGAGAAVALAGAVVVVGVVDDHQGRADTLALVGFFGYLAYLGLAALVMTEQGRRVSAETGSVRGQSFHSRRTARPAATAPAVAPVAPAPSSPSCQARRPVR